MLLKLLNIINDRIGKLENYWGNSIIMSQQMFIFDLERETVI